jgi:hypothetical protein
VDAGPDDALELVERDHALWGDPNVVDVNVARCAGIQEKVKKQ